MKRDKFLGQLCAAIGHLATFALLAAVVLIAVGLVEMML